jgi:predicted SnoaL-like aldol condensation-catalyzing enzyme
VAIPITQSTNHRKMTPGADHAKDNPQRRLASWVAADVVRFEDGLLREHWDVLQDEATEAESVSGLPMFGDRFPA